MALISSVFTHYTRRNLIIALVATLFYVATYILLAPFIGLPGAFAIPLACILGWLFRMRGGLLSGIIIILLTISLSYLTTGSFGRSAALWVGYLMILALCPAFGWLHNYIDRVSAQASQLAQAKIELQKTNLQLQRETETLHLRESALAAAVNAIIITNTQGLVEWVNPAFTKLTGYTAAEIIGQSPRLLNSGKHDAKFFSDLWHTILAGNVWQGETINRRKDGTLYTEEQTITPVRDANGTIIRFISIKQDITTRKQAEETLRQKEELLAASEARFRQIVENASDVIYRTDRNGYFIYVNPTALRLLGLHSYTEILGKRFTEIATPDYRHQLVRFYQRQIITKETNSYYEFKIPTKLGYDIWLGQNVQLIIENNEIIGFQAVARDITERKRAEEALAIARDQALEANRFKSQMLAKVSHELRTPLSSILGFAELLNDGTFGELTADQKPATEQIITSVHYLNIIVNELLDEAQISSKTIILRPANFAPLEMLQLVESTMLPLARQKGLEFTALTQPNFPSKIYGDQQRLQQILINLISNAIKFTKVGKVRAELFCPDETRWAMRVSDTGVGLSAEAQSYIFEPFRQVNNAITRENSGTGLGLSITKQLVELMNGNITLVSTVGQGSTFTITLPLEAPN